MSLQGAIIMSLLINFVDEDQAITAGMAELLSAHGFEVDAYDNAEDYLESNAIAGCSISFVSFGLSRQGARRILAIIRDEFPHAIVVMTSDGVCTKDIVDAIKLGAENVLDKPFTADQILALITQIQSQPKPIDNESIDLPATIASKLTTEEQRILVMIEQGVPVKQIAMRIDTSIRTVHYRKADILLKTNCKNCSEVVSKVSALRTLTNGARRPMMLNRYNEAIVSADKIPQDDNLMN